MAAALAPELLALMTEYAPLGDLTPYARELPLLVERRRAGFAAWYEFFPRSATDDPAVHGTFRQAEAWLHRIAALGFDARARGAALGG